MVDITSYSVQENEPYTHIVSIGDDITYIDGSIIEKPSDWKDIFMDAYDNEYHISEVIRDICIPYVIFTGEDSIGAQCLQAIMKRLYNTFSPIAIIHMDNDDKIICAPYARVNPEMLKEISETFEVLCKYRNIDYTRKLLKYMPLTRDVITYKDGTELDVSVALHDIPACILSLYVSNEEALSMKVKMNSKQSKNAALIDSIIMYSRDDIKGDKAKAYELITLINKDRSRDISYFLTMGRCLHRIFKGDGEGLDLWRTATIDNILPLCDEYWPTLDTTSTYHRIHTLQYWASIDSPEQYQKWNSISVRTALEASVLSTGGISDIATVAYRKNPTIFICDGDDPLEAKFYKFNNTYYKPCGMFTIQAYIDSDVKPEYEQFLVDLGNLSSSNNAGTQGNSFSEMIQSKIDKCTKIIVKLKDDAFQTKIVRALMRIYNKPGFDKVRDSNPYLTAFEDCVFDGEKKCIRDGIPEDHLTSSTEYEFKESWNEYQNYVDDNGVYSGWNHPDVKVVLENMEKIISNPEKREFIRRENAALLYSGNTLKRGLVISGPTNNGKSIFYSWLGKTLGKIYCPTVPNNLFYSEDSHPGAATPHYEMARFGRLILQSEVSDNKTLDEDLFKRWTGAVDEITYRALYGRKVQSFIPRSIPVTVCNTFPKLNGNSASLRTRIIVVMLSSKFITEKDPEYERLEKMTEDECIEFMKTHNWYWANTSFERQVINKTYKAFMWIMIQDYIKHSQESVENVQMRKPPKCIQNETITYFMKSNLFLQFIKACTSTDPNSPGVTTYQLYNTFKKWFQDSVSRRDCVKLTKFEEELANMSIVAHNDMYTNLVVTYQ